MILDEGEQEQESRKWRPIDSIDGARRFINWTGGDTRN